LKAQGGIKMYAEVYRWFTETSGLGLMGQAAKLMDPKAAAKESDVAEAIEQWEEKVNRLARHGEEYQLNESFKKVALKKILVGKILDNFEILHLDKLPFEEIMVRVKELARIKKLEKDVAQGRAGVNVGSQKPNGPGKGHQHQYDVPSFEAQEEEPTDVNAFNGKGPGWGQQSKGKSKGKGKGKDQKGGKSKGKGKGGKAQQQQNVNAVGTNPGFSGCFHCGG